MSEGREAPLPPIQDDQGLPPQHLHGAVRTGTEQMEKLAHWYQEQSKAGTRVGFFQIGGGIAADFSICVVPM